MLGKKGIVLELTDSAKDLLADLGYDPQFGARPLKRVLQKEVLNELSKQLLSGDFDSGDTIYVDTDAKGLVFGKSPVSEKATSNGNGKTAAKPAPKKEDREKKLEELKKATKDVEDAVKKIDKEKGDAKDN